MTTQMKQAIEILQFSNYELNDYLAEAVESNPLLELAPVREATVSAEILRSRMNGGALRRGGTDSPGASSVIEQTASYEITLMEWLESQLNLRNLPAQTLQITRFLIGSIDESGYLRESSEAVADLLEVSVQEVDEAVAVVQECDPPGIGARDLRECLLLQIMQVPDAERDLVRRLIESFLEDVASGKLINIARRLKVPVEQVQAAVDQLRRLNPRPGLGFQHGNAPYVIPDVVVKQVEDAWVVMTNESSYTPIAFNPGYRRFIQAKEAAQTSGADAQHYLTDKLHAARWLMRCLEQRRMTLYRVAEAIVTAQTAFFEHGPQAMKPLTLRQIADELGVHESTVSRATRGKYMQTPRGVVEMKYFFSAEVSGPTGAVSARSAKHIIQSLVRAEDTAHPLSDEALVSQLLEQGVRISRRTVAKYREELDIPPSWRRRRFDVGS